MQTLVRSASLTDYLEVARSVGLNPSRLLAGVGLSRRCLRNPDFKVPEDAVRELLESSAAAAGVEDFGLRMAERRTLSNFGPLALLLRDQPTIRRAIEAWQLYSKVHTDSVSVRIDENDGVAIISMVRSIESFAPKRQGVEMTVGVLYRAIRQFLGDGWRPRVCFVHSAPRNLDTHRRVFGSKVEFNCDFNGIICCTSDLDTPVPAADPAMARYAQQYVDSIKPAEASFGERVRELVALLLASGDCRMERVAEQMGVDRKTVHRHLAGRAPRSRRSSTQSAPNWRTATSRIASGLCRWWPRCSDSRTRARFHAGSRNASGAVSQRGGRTITSSFSRSSFNPRD